MNRRPASAEERKPKIIAVFDVRAPKRIINRIIRPGFFQGGREIVHFHFLCNTFSRLKNDGTTRCDRLTDEELVHEVLYRCEHLWKGALCFLFTADQGFYGAARRAVRRSNLLVIHVPLCGKPNFTREEVAAHFKNTVTKALCQALYRVRDKRAIAYFKRRLAHPAKQKQVN